MHLRSLRSLACAATTTECCIGLARAACFQSRRDVHISRECTFYVSTNECLSEAGFRPPQEIEPSCRKGTVVIYASPSHASRVSGECGLCIGLDALLVGRSPVGLSLLPEHFVRGTPCRMSLGRHSFHYVEYSCAGGACYLTVIIVYIVVMNFVSCDFD